MTVQPLRSEEARQQWSTLLDNALRGIPTIIQRYTKPIAVLVNYDEYQSLKRMHAELLAERRAQEDLPWEDVKAELIRDGVIDG